MTQLLSTIQEIIRDELRGVRLTELGVVEATFPHADGSDRDNYGCDVRLRGSDLLLKRVPVSTNHIGTAAIPNVGDLVLLTFDQGDINQPIIIGRLYTDTERPPANHNDEIMFRLPLQKSDTETIKAVVRNFQDREILIELPSKITIQIVDDTVKVVAGRTEMTLEQPGGADGVATLQSGRSKITLHQDGDVTIEAAGNMTLKAPTGDIAIEGKNVAIKSTMDTSIDATMQANVSGKLGATVEGLSATLKGLTVSVKGMTSFTPG